MTVHQLTQKKIIKEMTKKVKTVIYTLIIMNQTIVQVSLTAVIPHQVVKVLLIKVIIKISLNPTQIAILITL